MSMLASPPQTASNDMSLNSTSFAFCALKLVQNICGNNKLISTCLKKQHETTKKRAGWCLVKLNCSDSKLRAAPFDSRFARTASNRLLRSSNEGVGALGLHSVAWCSQLALELVVAYSNPQNDWKV